MRLTPSFVLRGVGLAVATTRIARGARRRPPLARQSTLDARSVSVVIPARDEAERIGPCLDALRGTEVIVVDDHSADHTRAVARRHGARVLDAGPLPAGWAGKAHALQRGVESATGDIVITLDADTRAEPELIEALVAALGDNVLVTAGAGVDAPPAEQPIHSSMLATLLYRFGPPGARQRPKPHRMLANGQCMVIDRDRFLAAGGLGPVAGSLTEDLALVRHLAAEGHPVGFVDGTRLVRVEGYGGATEVWHGWGRSIALAEVTSVPWQLADLFVLTTALGLPLPRLVTRRGDVVDLAAVVLRIGALAALAPTYRNRSWQYWLAPLVDPAVVARIMWTSARPSRSWRGRTYA